MIILFVKSIIRKHFNDSVNVNEQMVIKYCRGLGDMQKPDISVLEKTAINVKILPSSSENYLLSV